MFTPLVARAWLSLDVAILEPKDMQHVCDALNHLLK